MKFTLFLVAFWAASFQVYGGTYARLRENSDVILWAEITNIQVRSIGANQVEIEFQLKDTAFLSGRTAVPIKLYAAGEGELRQWQDRQARKEIAGRALFFLRKRPEGRFETPLKGEEALVLFPDAKVEMPGGNVDDLIAQLLFSPEGKTNEIARSMVGDVTSDLASLPNLFMALRKLALKQIQGNERVAKYVKKLEGLLLEKGFMEAARTYAKGNDQIALELLRLQSAWNAADWATMGQIVTGSASSALLATQKRDRVQQGELTEWNVTNLRLGATEATVEGEFTYSKGGKRSEIVVFRREDGIWRLAAVSVPKK